MIDLIKKKHKFYFYFAVIIILFAPRQRIYWQNLYLNGAYIYRPIYYSVPKIKQILFFLEYSGFI